jgi:hypothetical protein
MRWRTGEPLPRVSFERETESVRVMNIREAADGPEAGLSAVCYEARLRGSGRLDIAQTVTIPQAIM